MQFLAYVIPLLVSFSAFLLVLSLIPAKSALAEQLERLKSNTSEADVAEKPFERLFTEERRARLKQQLAEAGWYTVTPAQMGLRVVAGTVFGIVVALCLWLFLPLNKVLEIIFMVLSVVIGGYAPIFLLHQAMDERKAKIQRALPDFLDMMCSTVQAGLALNAAMDYAVDAAPGPLGEEISEALSEIRFGRSRIDALRAAAERANQPAFKTAILAISQAERLGSNVSKVLSELAEDTRNHRLMTIEEMAAKLPVKMVFPMMFFMLPAIIVVIFGTVAANYFATK
jgi:tight adherence protein C